MSPCRIVVLVSGGGSNLAAMIQATADPGYGAHIVAVGADRHDTGGQRIAEEAGIPTFVTRTQDYADRMAWDRALTESVEVATPDLVVCAGFLKLVGPTFLARFDGRVVNTHNSLLPAFPGTNGPADALAYGIKVAGATLFFVDGGTDTGPIIAQTVVPVLAEDDEAALTERIKIAERAQLVEQIGLLAREGWRIEGRRVLIGTR